MKKYLSFPLTWLALSACCLFIYVLVFTPNVPIGDQWDSVPVWTTQGWTGALNQVNQHRTEVLNVIVFTLARLTGWELRAETIASFLLLATLIGSIYFAFTTMVKDRGARQLFGLVMLTQMTPIHHENILWGFSAIVFSSLLVFWAIMAVGLFRRTIWAICLLAIASFSFLSGLLGWFPVAFLVWKDNKHKTMFAIALALCFLLYFVGYKVVAVGGGSATPVLLIEYFLIYFGAFLVPTYRVGVWLGPLLWASGTLGLGLLFLGAVILKKTWRSDRSEIIIPQAMMIFSVLNALATTMGRAGLGLEYALLSRYHVMQVFYCVGLAWLGLLELVERDRLQIMLDQ